MMQHVIAKLVLRKRIQRTWVSIDCPVPRQFLRAKNQHTFVAQFEIFDNCEGSISLSEAHAVGKNAPVVVEDLIDSGLRPVFLEREKCTPDASIRQRNALEDFIEIAGAVQEVAKQMK